MSASDLKSLAWKSPGVQATLGDFTASLRVATDNSKLEVIVSSSRKGTKFSRTPDKSALELSGFSQRDSMEEHFECISSAMGGRDATLRVTFKPIFSTIEALFWDSKKLGALKACDIAHANGLVLVVFEQTRRKWREYRMLLTAFGQISDTDKFSLELHRKDAEISAVRKQLLEKDKEIDAIARGKVVVEKRMSDSIVLLREKDQRMQEMEQRLQEMDQRMQEMDGQMQELGQRLREKEQCIEEQKEEMQKNEQMGEFVKQKQRLLKEKEAIVLEQLAASDKKLKQKDQRIGELQAYIKEIQATVKEATFATTEPKTFGFSDHRISPERIDVPMAVAPSRGGGAGDGARAGDFGRAAHPKSRAQYSHAPAAASAKGSSVRDDFGLRHAAAGPSPVHAHSAGHGSATGHGTAVFDQHSGGRQRTAQSMFTRPPPTLAAASGGSKPRGKYMPPGHMVPTALVGVAIPPRTALKPVSAREDRSAKEDMSARRGGGGGTVAHTKAKKPAHMWAAREEPIGREAAAGRHAPVDAGRGDGTSAMRKKKKESGRGMPAIDLQATAATSARSGRSKRPKSPISPRSPTPSRFVKSVLSSPRLLPIEPTERFTFDASLKIGDYTDPGMYLISRDRCTATSRKKYVNLLCAPIIEVGAKAHTVRFRIDSVESWFAVGLVDLKKAGLPLSNGCCVNSNGDVHVARSIVARDIFKRMPADGDYITVSMDENVQSISFSLSGAVPTTVSWTHDCMAVYAGIACRGKGGTRISLS